MTYFNQYIFEVFLLIMMVVIIYMNKILTTRENKGLFYNSALKTRSYSDGKKSNSFPPGDPSETGSLIPREGIKGRGLNPH